ncbi:minor tail protein [Gordonia phage William]|uniref:Minor tail protein n=1 Tax=Gordonia phage William TaxID=2571253 RepID=A0A4Y6EG90_9CAUD|nr:minor tail protein [Gordonia phage William]QDF17127.1 minor tail protein [Gordonia phage William]
MTTLVGSDGQTVTLVAPQSGSIDVTPPTSVGLLIPVPGVPGPPGPQGEGFNLIPPYFADSYGTLPVLDEEAAGGAMLVLESGLLYFWSGVAWTDEGAGVPFRGETGLPGRGIAAVDIIGNQLQLVMSDATTDTVTVPAIQQAIDSAAAASGSATAANTARLAAEAAASTAGTAASTATSERTAAQTARTGAESARDTATTAATAASNSAGAAATSETNAEASADAADGSAVAAAGSASTATGHATAASTARTGAETARTGAESARDAAQTSATGAAASAEDASDSAQAAAASAAEAADVVLSGVPNATDTTRGGIVLAGDLGGTWDNPTVPGLAAKADLVDGKVPTSQIPSQALIERRVVVSTAARLALTDVQPGDVAIQIGNPGRGTYILAEPDPSLEASWSMFVVPDSPVSSVNGYTGIVILGKGDVGLANVDNTSDAAKPISTAAQAALDGKLDKTSQTVRIYGTDGAGAQTALVWAQSAATANTIPRRTASGAIFTADGTDPAHAASKGQLDTGLAGKSNTGHAHDTSAIATGTLDVARLPVGTTAAHVAAGNDSRITNAVPNTRAVNAGTGLEGGGTLDTSRTLSVKYGNTAGTAAQGDDARLSDTRTPTDNTVSTAKIQNGAVTVAKLASEVNTTIQGMIDTSVLAAQRITVNSQTGAYTLVLADANKAVEVTTATAVNLTIPTDASVAFPVGTVIEVDQMGAGKVTIVGASGVTIQSAVTPPTTRTQYSAVVLRKRAANLWLVTGDM